MKILRKAATAVIAGTFAAGGVIVSAAEKSSVEERILSCAGFTNIDQRLSCFDLLAVELDPSHHLDSEPVAVEPELIDSLQENPQENIITPTIRSENTEPAGEVSEKSGPGYYTLTLSGAEKDTFGLWVFTFENGEIWRQIEGGYASLPDQFPAEATIRRGALGSHSMRIEGNHRLVKVRKLN